MVFIRETSAYTSFFSVIMSALKDTNLAIKVHCSVTSCPVCLSNTRSVCSEHSALTKTTQMNKIWSETLQKKTHLGGVKRAVDVCVNSFLRFYQLHKGSYCKRNSAVVPKATSATNNNFVLKNKQNPAVAWLPRLMNCSLLKQQQCWPSIFNELQKFLVFLSQRPSLSKSHMRARERTCTRNPCHKSIKSP